MTERCRFQPGIYQILSYATTPKIALDLSGGDLKSILGFPAHQGVNQKWELSPLGKGYSIRSLHTGDYLTIENAPINATHVVVNPYPVSWALASDNIAEGVWRIAWPNTKFAIGLPVFKSNPGTLAQFVDVDNAESGSLWQFILQRALPEAASDLRPSPEAAPASSTSITHTKIGEDGEFTVTTTTTTVVTTVTKVAKTRTC